MVKDMTDEQLDALRRGGHDPQKVYAAFKAAVEHEGQPTVVLVKTVKGYGMGEAGEELPEVVPAHAGSQDENGHRASHLPPSRRTICTALRPFAAIKM